MGNHNQTIGDELIKVSVDTGYSGSRTVTVSGDPEVVKSVDVLAMIREVTREEGEEAAETAESLRKIESRMASLEGKGDLLEARLKGIEGKVDSLVLRLDRFLNKGASYGLGQDGEKPLEVTPSISMGGTYEP